MLSQRDTWEFMPGQIFSHEEFLFFVAIFFGFPLMSNAEDFFPIGMKSAGERPKGVT